REDPVYHAPEQAWEQATHRSDIYAFGAILYEMLSGTPAMVPSRLRVYLPLQNCRVDITPGVERIVMQALEVSPERRQTDISAVCNALAAELTSESQPALVTRGTGRARTGVKRLAWSGALVMSLLVLWFASVRITRDGPSLKFLVQPSRPETVSLGTPAG